MIEKPERLGYSDRDFRWNGWLILAILGSGIEVSDGKREIRILLQKVGGLIMLQQTGIDSNKVITIDYHDDYNIRWYYGVLRYADSLAEIEEDKYVFLSKRLCKEYLEDKQENGILPRAKISFGKWREKKGALTPHPVLGELQ